MQSNPPRAIRCYEALEFPRSEENALCSSMIKINTFSNLVTAFFTSLKPDVRFSHSFPLYSSYTILCRLVLYFPRNIFVSFKVLDRMQSNRKF